MGEGREPGLQGFGPYPEERSDRSLARIELASELRAWVHAIGGSAASAERLRELAEWLRGHREALQAEGEGAAADDEGGIGLSGMEDFHDRSPITGGANPLAPPATLRIDRAAERVRGEVMFDAAFEGAPGIVHGGFVAAVLDEALGMATVFSGSPGMTGELVTTYRRHTPVSVPLQIEARLASVEGRKIYTVGEIRHDERVIVEARGLFVAVDPGKFAALKAERDARG